MLKKLFLHINEETLALSHLSSFCSWILIFFNFDDLKTSVEPYGSVLKVCQIFSEVGGALRRESAMELENPLKL